MKLNLWLLSLLQFYFYVHLLLKTYVQDLLRQNSEKVFETLQNVKGHLYVSGDVNMAAGVSATVQSILAKHGEMTKEEAKKRLKRLKVRIKKNSTECCAGEINSIHFSPVLEL